MDSFHRASWSRGYTNVSCSTQLNMKFQMLIVKNVKKFSFVQAQTSLECYFSFHKC